MGCAASGSVGRGGGKLGCTRGWARIIVALMARGRGKKEKEGGEEKKEREGKRRKGKQGKRRRKGKEGKRRKEKEGVGGRQPEGRKWTSYPSRVTEQTISIHNEESLQHNDAVTTNDDNNGNSNTTNTKSSSMY